MGEGHRRVGAGGRERKEEGAAGFGSLAGREGEREGKGGGGERKGGGRLGRRWGRG